MPDDNVTISPDEEALIEKLRLTSRCRDDIYETSRFFTDLPGNRFEALVQHLIQSGESNALGILMNIAAVIGVRPRSDLKIAFSIACTTVFSHGETTRVRPSSTAMLATCCSGTSEP